MGCCVSLLKCCVRAETENPLLDSPHLGEGGSLARGMGASQVGPFHALLCTEYIKYETMYFNDRPTLRFGDDFGRSRLVDPSLFHQSLDYREAPFICGETVIRGCHM